MSLPLPSINSFNFGGMGAANLSNMCHSAPPLKRRRIYEPGNCNSIATNSTSPISPPRPLGTSMDTSMNNDDKAKQVSFLNTLLKAAAFVENENEDEKDSTSMAMGISNAQHVPTSTSSFPILGQLGQMNMAPAPSNNFMSLPNQTMFNFNNGANVQYVAVPTQQTNNQPQVIYATHNQLASLMNGQMAFQPQLQQQQVPFATMNNMYQPQQFMQNNMCFQSYVQPNMQQQQMLMTQNIAPVQNVNILQQPRPPQTQFVFVMNDDKSMPQSNANNNVQM